MYSVPTDPGSTDETPPTRGIIAVVIRLINVTVQIMEKIFPALFFVLFIFHALMITFHTAFWDILSRVLHLLQQCSHAIVGGVLLPRSEKNLKNPAFRGDFSYSHGDPLKK